MHVVALPPERHPDADPQSEPPADSLWWLAESRPGRCKSLARDLSSRGVPCYRAVGRFSVVWADGGKRLVTRPLFPNYVFVLSDERGRAEASRSRHSRHVEAIADQQRFRSELASLDTLFSTPGELSLGPAVKVSGRCRVLSGHYEGAVGLVRRLGTRGRLYVELTVMGQAASVELDLSQVEPCP